MPPNAQQKVKISTKNYPSFVHHSHLCGEGGDGVELIYMQGECKVRFERRALGFIYCVC